MLNFLEFSVDHKKTNLEFMKYRKPMQMDIIIQNDLNIK